MKDGDKKFMGWVWTPGPDPASTSSSNDSIVDVIPEKKRKEEKTMAEVGTKENNSRMHCGHNSMSTVFIRFSLGKAVEKECDRSALQQQQ